MAPLLWLHLIIHMVCGIISMVTFGYPCDVCGTIAMITFGYPYGVWHHCCGYIWLSTWCATSLLGLHLVTRTVCCTIAMVTFGYPHGVCRRFCGAAEVRADSKAGHVLEPGLRPHRLPGPLHQSGCGHR